MIPPSFGDIALLNHLLEEWGTRYQVRWKDCFTACLEPPGECCFTPELQREALGLVERFYREKGLAVVFSPDKLFFFGKEAGRPRVNQAVPQNRAAWFRIGRERAL